MSVSNQTSTWDFLFTELADHRTSNWFLLKDPIAGLTIVVLYLSFVLKWGPNYMKNRKPYNLKNVLIVYNFCQVVFSCWLVFEALDGAWLHYSWRCEPVDPSETPEAMRVCRGVYIYFVSKLVELLDTIFFVLRKNDRQISFLHLYHHTGMFMISWVACKYYPGGNGTFVGLINSFVHAVMYLYYLLAAFGPKFKKYLWWKKYITNMQMMQFGIVFIHDMQLVFYDCGYPRISLIFTLPNSIFFYYLFNDFYQKNYKRTTMENQQNEIKEGEVDVKKNS